MPSGEVTKTWQEYRELVLQGLEAIRVEMKSQGDAISKIQIDVAMLKVKAGVWGLLGGLIPVTIALVYELLKSK